MLKVLQRIYFCLTTLEKYFFYLFNFLVYRSKARVISIGNLSMGGTGKTPVLFELLRELEAHNICVLTRGYRSKYERSFHILHGQKADLNGLTDESIMLNLRFPKIPILIGKNRHHSAMIAGKLFKPELMLLDDGFQYRRLKKDIDILLWDAMSTPAEACLLPVGKLREPVSRIKDATAIFLTRCESVDKNTLELWKNWLYTNVPKIPVIMVHTLCDGIFDYSGKTVEKPDNVMAFSAIGRPDSFYKQLKLSGINVVKYREFRDHHEFTEQELREVSKTAIQSNLKLICTEKDFCKIKPELAQELGISFLRIVTRPVSQKTFSAELKDVGISLFTT